MVSIPNENHGSLKTTGPGYYKCRQFRHFYSFSVVSIIVILFVVWFGLKHIFRGLIVSQAERDAVQVSEVARDCEIRQYVQRYNGEKGKVLDIPPSDVPLVDSEMRIFTKSFDIVKIKIYNGKHRIIYSTDPKIIGRSDPNNTLLLTAMGGTPVSKYQSRDQLWDLQGEQHLKGEIAETYVPIRGQDGSIIGSFEVYKDISKDLAMMRTILVRSWTILAATVLAIFSALMFVIRRAAQTIEVTNRNLAATNEKLQQEVKDREKLENELLNVIERERHSIGQELHDGIGQQLAGITFMVEVLKKKLRRKSSVEEMPFATRIGACVNQVARQTRNLAKGLHPIDLDGDGLVPALEELAVNTEQIFDVSCTLEAEAAISTNDASVIVNLYRIAQEAITNAVKHGKAKNVRIRLTSRNGSSELSVENDGLAFPDRQVHGGGLGLRIMRYRAETILGSLNIRKGAHGGTLVTCVFPNEEQP